MAGGSNNTGCGCLGLIAAVAIIGGIANACGGGSSSTSTASSTSSTPAPSPTGSVAQVLSPANFVLADGRRVHVTMLNDVNTASSGACEQAADQQLAQQMLADQTVTVAQPRMRDADGIAAPGFVQADVWLPDGRPYADTYRAAYYPNREAACPVATPTPEPATAPTSSSSGGPDVYVNGGGGGDHHGPIERRVCRHTWLC